MQVRSEVIQQPAGASAGRLLDHFTSDLHFELLPF